MVLLAGCAGNGNGNGDSGPSESELKERFNEHEALNVEAVVIDDAQLDVEYWTSDNDDSPPEDEMAAMVDVYESTVADHDFDRLDAAAYDPLSEELEFEWHVLTEWLDEDDTMERVNETRT